MDSVSTARSRQGWRGTCVHDFETPRWVQKRRRVDPDEPHHLEDRVYEEPRRAVAIAINEGVTPKSKTIQVPNPYNRVTGEVCALEWSSDGYVLAVGWRHGWGIFSVGGRCLASGFGVDDIVDEDRFQDAFMYGVRNLASGHLHVLLVSLIRQDNTRYAFLQMDDRALIYRGADQPDMSVINPESDVWQHIKIPQSYLATNWPIQYSSLSSDGRLIAVAGRRGLIHYSSTSGRWKTFNDEQQEQAFVVKGGLLWFHHVLIAAVEVSKTHQIRLYSRDMDLSNQNVLHREVVPSHVVILSLVDNSLLVYTANNTLYHFLIVPTAETIKLHLCGSITFDGIISAPSAVRMLSWMIPTAQKQLGDPVDDLSVATVLLVVGGQLILLRPRKSANQEVKYDMQIFADHVEFCWIHLRGIGTLENSLWVYDGQGIRVWLNALTIEAPLQQEKSDDKPENVKESVNIPLDFYPLSTQRLKTAGSYLLVLHNLEQLDENNDDAVRLLQGAVDGKDWQLCRELLRFLHSVDDTGFALRNALSKTNVVSLIENDSEVSSKSSESPLIYDSLDE
ncbi:hypothetical protein C0993_010881 [Termitomyces sp. T159_Od127]|nr:hypothetical protein C0993_010881 [Termitomyces sp. T159_Od127]